MKPKMITPLVKTVATDANLICQLANGLARFHALERLQLLVLMYKDLNSLPPRITRTGPSTHMTQVPSRRGGCGKSARPDL
ncbi:hypothetical protein X756_31400 [Mesorhizobium sp. LSHC412B00]|nr:hypothetical protein X756_31400 [Mesorhizobium sp. LSHC412B00]